eukprot:gb/GECG01003320.1/.p1 GENE.gb/GECG01003320.1/~~gb/GECG01003320.1/.p1  ORF type:complete len:173 (+),score=20.38 gb/GECG01003320.1/:1-519(+)
MWIDEVDGASIHMKECQRRTQEPKEHRNMKRRGTEDVRGSRIRIGEVGGESIHTKKFQRKDRHTVEPNSHQNMRRRETEDVVGSIHIEASMTVTPQERDHPVLKLRPHRNLRSQKPEEVEANIAIKKLKKDPGGTSTFIEMAPDALVVSCNSEEGGEIWTLAGLPTICSRQW